jgi:hypothetical protein
MGVSYLDRRIRNGNVADHTIDVAASLLNRSRYQYSLARGCASFHQTLIRRNH